MDLKNKTLLIVSPHPDDEVLGCGGLIKRIKDNGGKVYVIYLTNGDTIEYSSKDSFSSQEERLVEIKKVAKYLQYDGWRIALPGNTYHLRLDAIPQVEIVSSIENGADISIEAIHPDIIATPQASDYNQDHRVCAHAVITACRPSPHNSKSAIKAILGYEFTATVGWGIEPHLTRNVFVKLSEKELNAKLHAMKLYSSQVREASHTRSLENIKTLAKLRGGTCGVEYAEAFHAYRMVF